MATIILKQFAWFLIISTDFLFYDWFEVIFELYWTETLNIFVAFHHQASENFIQNLHEISVKVSTSFGRWQPHEKQTNKWTCGKIIDSTVKIFPHRFSLFPLFSPPSNGRNTKGAQSAKNFFFPSSGRDFRDGRESVFVFCGGNFSCLLWLSITFHTCWWRSSPRCYCGRL